jgi:hypothetical protein
MNKAPIERRKLSTRMMLLFWLLRVYVGAGVLITAATFIKQLMP